MPIIGAPIALNLDTILFATDFSSSSETAQLYVQALATRYHSQVRLMHVVDLGAAFKTPNAGISIDVFRRMGEEALGRVGGQLADAKIEVTTILTEDVDPPNSILEATRDKSVELMA